MASPAELAAELDKCIRGADYARIGALLAPAERTDWASNLIGGAAMKCAMAEAFAGLGSGQTAGIDVDLKGMDQLKAACDGMAHIAEKHGSRFTVWQAVGDVSSSKDELDAAWARAKKTLDGKNVLVLLRELQDAERKAGAEPAVTFEQLGRGVDASGLRVGEDSATVPVRGTTGHLTFLRSEGRWYLSVAQSEWGQTEKEVAAQRLAEASASDQAALREAMHGSWASAWGRADFQADGRATFELRSCAADEQRPWRSEPGSCETSSQQGKAELELHQIGLSDGSLTTLFASYVDASGRLHMAEVQADIGKIDAQRSGQVKQTMFRTIHVQDGSCRLENSQEETNVQVACAFVKDEGVELLRVDAPLPGETGPAWFVYLPKEGLLVPPEVYRTALDRVGDAR